MLDILFKGGVGLVPFEDFERPVPDEDISTSFL